MHPNPGLVLIVSSVLGIAVAFALMMVGALWARVRSIPVEETTRMVDDLARVLADEIRLDLLDGGGDGLGPPLDDGFTQADDAVIRMDLQKQPARLDQKRLQLRDLERIFACDRRVFLV